MKNKTESRRKEEGPRRSERAADRASRTAPRKTEFQTTPTGRDEKSIGATRLPRKGDDSETD
jgi:hypothetical protein